MRQPDELEVLRAGISSGSVETLTHSILADCAAELEAIVALLERPSPEPVQGAHVGVLLAGVARRITAARLLSASLPQSERSA